jgi:tumor protein p53-inducible protein 3
MALLSGGGYAEYVAVHKDHFMPIPKNIDVNQAAAITEVWLTSYLNIRF